MFGNRDITKIALDMDMLFRKFPDMTQVQPPVRSLFLKGNLGIILEHDFFVSIVGTRRCSSYGIKIADMFGGHISRRGYCVVSGLAAGIDAAAHKGALARGGRTIGVAAGGIDSIFPLSNARLFDQMAKKACIIAEYEGVTDHKKFRFPLRNRIVAAMSDLIIVVEAPEKSGALITARMGLELGKTVAAVPGSVFSMSSIGSNKLIEDGAIPLCSTRQLDDMIQILQNSPSFAQKKSEEMRENIEKRNDSFRARNESLSRFSSEILLMLRARKKIDLFETASEIGISITDAMDIFEELRKEGLVEQDIGDKFLYVPPQWEEG